MRPLPLVVALLAALFWPTQAEAASLDHVPVSMRHALHAAAQEASLPPSILASLVAHESRWKAHVVGGRDGQCVGLTQVCLHTVRACRKGRGYAFDAPACQAHKGLLLDGPANLRIAGRRLAAWRRLCLARTGHAEPGHVLSGFGGYDTKHGLTCGQRRLRGRWVTQLPAGVVAILRGAR